MGRGDWIGQGSPHSAQDPPTGVRNVQPAARRNSVGGAAATAAGGAAAAKWLVAASITVAGSAQVSVPAEVDRRAAAIKGNEGVDAPPHARQPELEADHRRSIVAGRIIRTARRVHPLGRGPCDRPLWRGVGQGCRRRQWHGQLDV